MYPEEAKKPFSLVDLVKISVHVKGMNLGLKAQANFFFSHGEYVESRTAGKDLAIEYYQTAKSLYSELLSSFPRLVFLIFCFHIFF